MAFKANFSQTTNVGERVRQNGIHIGDNEAAEYEKFVNENNKELIASGQASAEIDKLRYNTQELRNIASFIRNEKLVFENDIYNLKSCITRMANNWTGIAAEAYIEKINIKIQGLNEYLMNYDFLANDYDNSADATEAHERKLLNMLNRIK